MNADYEHTRSYWMTTTTLLEPGPLAAPVSCDACVIGAGIAGLSTAYELAREGLSVVVVDRGAFAGGMTARTTAHLASALDDYYHVLIGVRSESVATAYWRSQMAAIDRIEAIAHEEAVACDFRRLDGYLFLAAGDDPALIDRELEACHRIGYRTVTRVERAPVPSGDAGPALRFPDQARFHPLAYCRGLVSALERRGVRLHAGTAVTSLTEEAGRVRIETETRHTIDAGAAVVATNAPINDGLTIHAKEAPYRTYAMAFRIAEGGAADCLAWDTLEAYHYVRLQEDPAGGIVLIVGGEDHKTGEAEDFDARFTRLVDWTRRHYPAAGEEVARWSGQVMEPADALPFTGRYPGSKAIYVHTGDSGQGLTNGVAGALLLRDVVTGRENPLAEILDPARLPLRSLPDVVSENLTVAKNFAERLAPGDAGSIEAVRPGEAAIVRSGLTRLAVYRDQGGVPHVLSANCTHAGCLVHWNGLERCWECPCHGSHFATDGSVLNGPATSPLDRIDRGG